MKRDLYLMGFILVSASLLAQYQGGVNDGLSLNGTGPAYLSPPALFCSGGGGDGFHLTATGAAAMNDQLFYCGGGQGDAFAFADHPGYLFDFTLCYGGGVQDGAGQVAGPAGYFFEQDFYLSGGSGDGSADVHRAPANLNIQLYYCGGGSGDGFSEVSGAPVYVGNTALYATGGAGDGFHALAYAGPIVYSLAWLGGEQDGAGTLRQGPYAFSNPLFCLGGAGDGFTGTTLEASYLAPGAWLGSVSTAWENPANWSGNQVPGVGTDVLLLSGKRCYPVISSGNLAINHSGVHQCKSLRIGEGATVTNLSGLAIYGEMSVSGMYYEYGPNNQVMVFPGGNLVLSAPGQMLTGKP